MPPIPKHTRNDRPTILQPYGKCYISCNYFVLNLLVNSFLKKIYQRLVYHLTHHLHSNYNLKCLPKLKTKNSTHWTQQQKDRQNNSTSTIASICCTNSTIWWKYVNIRFGAHFIPMWRCYHTSSIYVLGAIHWIR